MTAPIKPATIPKGELGVIFFQRPGSNASENSRTGIVFHTERTNMLAAVPDRILLVSYEWGEVATAIKAAAPIISLAIAELNGSITDHCSIWIVSDSCRALLEGVQVGHGDDSILE